MMDREPLFGLPVCLWTDALLLCLPVQDVFNLRLVQKRANTLICLHVNTYIGNLKALREATVRSPSYVLELETIQSQLKEICSTLQINMRSDDLNNMGFPLCKPTICMIDTRYALLQIINKTRSAQSILELSAALQSLQFPCIEDAFLRPKLLRSIRSYQAKWSRFDALTCHHSVIFFYDFIVSFGTFVSQISPQFDHITQLLGKLTRDSEIAMKFASRLR